MKGTKRGRLITGARQLWVYYSGCVCASQAVPLTFFHFPDEYVAINVLETLLDIEQFKCHTITNKGIYQHIMMQLYTVIKSYLLF